MLIQRRNLLESARPELVLTGCSRNAKGTGDSAQDLISVGTIRNVGRGVAINVNMNVRQTFDDRIAAGFSTTPVSILSANGDEELNREIMLFWDNVASDKEAHGAMPINIDILCWDSRGVRHETRYNLLAVRLDSNNHLGDSVAPGVMLASRTTISRPVWWLKLLSKVERLRRCFPVAKRKGTAS